MSKIRLCQCSLTGVDEGIPLADLGALSKRFPVAEWGFVYVPGCAGRVNWFSSSERILNAMQQLPDYVRVALHLAGSGPADLLHDEDTVVRLFVAAAARSGRVQLHIDQRHDPVVLGALHDLVMKKSCTRFSTKFFPGNDDILVALAGLDNHSVLMDSGLEEGGLPSHWEHPIPGVMTGYAGGLSPDNLDAQLCRIGVATMGQPFWVDLIAGVRTEHRNWGLTQFDLGLCEKALDAAQPFMVTQQKPAAPAALAL